MENYYQQNSDYSEIVIVGAGADAVDFKLISLLSKGDICVSQDYGVAAMALGKGCYAIHQSGNANIYEFGGINDWTGKTVCI